jgi:hypothetical protein
MFHYTKLDMFCNAVKPYADTDGYVPEAEDIIQDFSYPEQQFTDLHSWNKHIQASVMATHTAEQKLHAWQNQL